MPGLRPRPRFYEHAVSGFAGPGKPAEGEPRVASFYSRGLFSSRQPNFSVSYLLSARCLIEDAGRESSEALAMPVGFLQRHAFELALKDLLGSANEVYAESCFLKARKLNREAAQTYFPDDPPKTHDLGLLSRRLAKALERIGYELPESVKALAKRLDKFEGEDASATRYPHILGPDFEVRMSEVQNELETLFEDVFAPASLFDMPDTLADELLHHSNAMGQEAYSRGFDDDVWRVQFSPEAEVRQKWGCLSVRSVLPEEQLAALLEKRPDLRPVKRERLPDGSLRLELDWTEAEKRRRKERARKGLG